MRQNRDFLRKMYPPGTRIQLDRMDDEYAVPSGTIGTVQLVDDACNIHVAWDNGRGLSLIPGEDLFHIVEEEPSLSQEPQMNGLSQ